MTRKDLLNFNVTTVCIDAKKSEHRLSYKSGFLKGIVTCFEQKTKFCLEDVSHTTFCKNTPCFYSIAYLTSKKQFILFIHRSNNKQAR